MMNAMEHTAHALSAIANSHKAYIRRVELREETGRRAWFWQKRTMSELGLVAFYIIGFPNGEHL
jgi:hypothetical protein